MLAKPQTVCPECGSEKSFHDGKRKLSNGSTAQRHICRQCGYRYTYPTSLNGNTNNLASNHICAKEAKNMDSTTETKTVAGEENEILSADTKGILTQYLAYLEKEGYCAESEYEGRVRRLAKLGADLRDPETVKVVIGRMKVKDGMKMQYECAYNAVCEMLKIQWDRPRYRQEEHDPFIPDESELDALINGARSKRLAVYLQALKETFGDPSETLRIKWIDINEKQRTIKINYPVKGHYTRTLEVSNRLLSMLSSLPRTSERVFPCQYASMLSTFTKMKRRLAETQKNPRLLSVELRSFRHWGGTMIAFHTNGNVLMVKKLLGHKRIENSMKYIGRINFKDDQFETTQATTVEEILKLGSAGWIEYSIVKANGLEIHCFKKPKRFANYA